MLLILTAGRVVTVIFCYYILEYDPIKINHIHFQAKTVPSQSTASPQTTLSLTSPAQQTSQLSRMWTLLFAFAALSSLGCCEPLPDPKANQEFDRLLSLAASGNLTPSANVPNYAPYTMKTLLDRYLENPGKLIKFLAYFV